MSFNIKLWLVLLVTVLATATFAQNNPYKDKNICGKKECKVDDRKFGYKVGTQHKYKYRVDASTLFEGTSKNESTLHIAAIVNLDFISPCEGILSVSDIKLSEYDIVEESEEERSSENLWYEEEEDSSQDTINSRLFAEAVNENKLRFAFDDGIIAEVCPYENEKSWVLNFKKGILTMMHNTMKRLDLDHHAMEEEDVRGRCDTKYFVQGTRETSLIIEKDKDLTFCDHRSQLHTMVQSTPYNHKIYNMDRSILNSTSHCELSIDHRIYNDIKCEESHVFVPFSNQAAGATTRVQQRLLLIDEVTEILEAQPAFKKRSPLLYDHVPTPKLTSDELKTSRDLIKKLCKMSTDDVQTEFSDLFTTFIHTSRFLSYPALSSLYKHSGSLCDTGKKHVLDALPYLGSSAAIALMKDIILKRAVQDSTAHEWMLSTALIPRPDISMMESINELLNNLDDPSIVLSVSTLTHTFCKQNEDCRSNEPVDGIIQLLEDRAIEAYNSHKTDRETQESLLVTLKAISNIGVASEAFKEELSLMIEDPLLDVAIRVAAVDAHRRFPCEESRPYFQEVFRNENEDAEVRIAAYLQVMRCPNYIVIKAIKHSLEVEEVNQVGSFIWSHLHNLFKSSIPSRVEIQGMLSDKDFSKKFSSDVRKFSHNYESSVFFEEYNVGGNFESNVIFSPTSYVPRSAMLNLTVDLFGESINLLEVYGRVEGFEHYLESIFGPKGPLSSKKVQDKIPKMRWSRSAQENELLKSQIDKLPYELEHSDGPKVAVGMKLFGNELKYATFNGDEEIKDALRTLNPLDHLKRILSGKEINYKKAAMFLDTSYVVSSGAGLPVTLNAVGTTSINMQLKGSLIANNFLKNRELDLSGIIKPSVAVDIVGTMSVDAYYANAAIKLKTSAYSSSAIEGQVKIQGSKLISVKFGIPKKTTELFGAKSEIIVMKGSREEPQAGNNNVRVSQSVCSWPAVDKTVGLKLCTDYHFMNVTDMSKSPYFILAGPAGFRLSLQKSDPTATTYLLEYRWNELPDSSHISLTFDTPGSTVRRVIGANVTIDKDSRNLTLLLQSTEGTILARGEYKNTNMEKYIQVLLDVNNHRNFDGLLSLKKKEITNGFLYEPKLFIGVNGDRVAELLGMVKLISKSGISQYDVDLKFETKRLASKLFGYISKTDASVSTSMKLNYKFVNTKEHAVRLDFQLANRSKKNIFVILGNANVETSAYPHYNFNSTLVIQKSATHLETKFVLNASPHLPQKLEIDKEMLTMQIFLTYRTYLNSTNFKISASAKRPSTELDVKGQLSYDVIGYSSNVMALVRYAKGKDVVVTLYWNHPRYNLENIDGRLNITIPSFSPMIVEGKLKEKISGEYMVELRCTWFSGHKLEFDGRYQDRSTALASNHRLKLVAKSPSFTEINADCNYHRNNSHFKIDIKADQSNDRYALYLEHIRYSPHKIMSVGKIKYKAKLYSISNFVSLKEKRELALELHIDQIRDIHLKMWADNKESHKKAGCELKWDANRDPDQKLAITVYYANLKPYNYEGNFLMSYPGRTINGIFNFILEDGHFSTTGRVAWSPDDAFALKLGADYMNEEEIAIKVGLELVTPFEEWKKTLLNGGIRHSGNMYRVNGSMYWQHDQHISIDLFGDYAATGSALKCEFTGSLDSTVRDIPSLSASVKHSHNTTKVESELHMMHQPKHKIAVTSSWQIDEDPHTKNLTGTVTLISPFKGFNKGLLVSKIYVTSERYLRGVAKLDMDHREFTASVKGQLKKLSNSMLVFNITTPLDKYKLISGKIGFCEDERYLVAMVVFPSKKTGAEVRFLIQSLTNFDIKFNLATPIEILQEILIVGKLQPQMADFEVGWNSLLLGFNGVWHYANVTDFEYSYKIYTPIPDFEENGIVAKLIFKEGLDFELSTKLAEDRLGIIIFGKPKPKILKEFGIKTQEIYNKKLNSDDSYYTKVGRNSEQEDEEDDDPFTWNGYMELNALILAPITAEVDIDQKGTVFDVVATLTLPAGKAELRDEFDFTDVFTMKNRLSLSTPYESCKLVTSNYDFKITTGHQYLLDLDFNYLNASRWIKAGTLAHYISSVEQDENAIYNITLHVHTPFQNLPRLDVNGALEMEDNVYRTNFSMVTNNSDISFVGDLEIDDGLLETEIAGHLTTSVLTLPASRITFKKEYSNAQNRIECHYMMLQNKANKLNLETSWRIESIKDMTAEIYLETPFKGMEKTEGAIEVHVTNNYTVAKANLMLFPIDVKANATVIDNDLQAAVTIDLGAKRHVMALNGKITDISEYEKELRGLLVVNNRKHNINANLQTNDKYPTGMMVEVAGHEGGSPLTIHYSLSPQKEKWIITTTLKEGQKFAQISATAVVKDRMDWDAHLEIETSHQIYKKLIVNAKAQSGANTSSVRMDASTPFERLEKIEMGSSLTVSENERQIKTFYALGDSGGKLDGTWTWLLLENMSIKLVGNYYKPSYTRDGSLNAFYVNSNKEFKSMRVGADVNLNQIWKFGSNLSFHKPDTGSLNLEANMLLPKPNIELHTVTGKLHRFGDWSDFKYLAKYRTLNSGYNYGSSGNVSYHNITNLNADVMVEWAKKHVRNYVDLRKEDDTNHLLYKLHTHKFEQDCIVADASFTTWNDFYNLTGEFFYPGNRSIGAGHINFKEFANMNGLVNVTIPIRGLNYTGATFLTETSALVHNRYIQMFWSNNNAFLDSKYITTEVDGSALERDTKGVLLVEIPLATRHIGRLDYEYNEKPRISVGLATIEYNNTKVLDGKYNCLSESRAGLDKDTIHVELENKLVPIGVDYIHGYEYSSPGDGSNTPTVDSKHLHVYNLHNKTAFDVTGNVTIHTKESGQEITLMAIHSNRTVKFATNYDIFDQEFKQYSRLDLSPTAWIAYDLDLLNKTMDETSEAQQIQINVSYPRRNFTALGSYNISNSSLSSGMSLDWHKGGEPIKTVQAEFNWKKDELRPNRQEVLIELMHPSFEKNIKILGEYDRLDRTLADVNLTVDYSTDPDQMVNLRGMLQNNSNQTILNYTYNLWGSHPATSLQLDVRGGVNYRSRWFYSYHLVDYKRTYLPLQSGEATSRIDLDRKEIEFKRKTLRELFYLWGRYAGKFPLYTANVSAIHEKDIIASGEFYLNFREKLLQLELNTTTDGSQSLHMKGYIPDARSSYFDIWRDYDGDRISDVASFLRMNHSRLLVSTIRWRPELKQDIKDAIRTISIGWYNDTMEMTDYWRQYIRSETADTINDIWQDAKPIMQDFLNDIKDLRVIEEDLQELKIFLNNSYHANEFHIKEVVSFILFVVDELSIKSHIESLPALFNEIWEVMGESGKKIQKSVTWVIEKLKSYYKNTAEFINGLIQGDSVEHVSDALKQLVEKYDNFIKDMHVAFIRYIEQLWKHTYRLLLDNWHKTLASIEPTFIKFIHYIETIVWNASKEVLDFLYIRKSEIIENPYFSKISDLTHDLERFYKDMTGNDTIGSIYKYTKVAWNFLKEKYFKLVPFGKEIQEVVNEIVNEVRKLQNLPYIRYLLDHYNKIEEKVEWFCKYFDLENKLHRFITLIHMKLTDSKQTALQAENKYREAKTKFIFEPADGIMHLEEKLPISWHAFNETPNFQEIPEYRAINELQKYFSSSKLTLSSLYYDYQPYMDPMDWLPPLKAQAMIIGSQHYVTFDRNILEFKGGCSYLLARDFLDGNFTIAVAYKGNDSGTHEVIAMVHDTVISVDVFSNSVSVNNDAAKLPLQIEDAVLYQDADIVTLSSEMGFELQCNMKFDVCMFEVSGWYFGKTAGLWGTMNNEPSDDLLTSNRTRRTRNDIQDFTASWALEPTCAGAVNKATPSQNTSEGIVSLCESFFDSHVSPFTSCFSRVSNMPFYRMCLNSISEDEACTSAVAYMKLCSYVNTPLRIPDACVKCNLVNGSVVPEGEFVSMENESIPHSSDIVFIVEAKECNKNLRQRKKLDDVVQQMEKELNALKVKNNRYSVVVFGGDGVYNRPRSVVINNTVFTEHQLISSYFDHIPTGNGSLDIFDAISYASKLIFRPGVSRTFILLPCSDCRQSNMKLDYTILHQLLLENDITLHILMNEEFRIKKTRMNKIKIFGVDRKLTFTKKHATGDAGFRKFVQLPKATLGYCTPLALETNGSVFSGKKLETEKLKSDKNITAVFAKRVARSTVSNTCKICECTAHNSGISYMECYPCAYPTPVAIDYGFDEDEMLSVMQPSEDELGDYSD